MRMRLVIIVAMAARIMAGAWQISGKVTELHSTATDNVAVPIEGAQVCEAGNPSNCAVSGAGGAFSLSGTGVAALVDAAPLERLSLEISEGKLFLRAPETLRGRLEWFDAGSGRLEASADILLSQGANALANPAASSAGGVKLIRFSAGGLRAVWKTALLEGFAYQGSASSPAIAAALAKTAAEPMPAVVASKAGFKSLKYYATDPAKDEMAWILLAAAADDTTYKEPGTSYPAAAVPPNEVTGRAHVGGGKGYAFGGAKVNNILGHSAAGNGSMTFKKIYAPADGNYDVTWSYFCGKDDNNGDKDCGGEADILTPSGCRPGILVINGVELPKVYQFKCFHEGWDVIHFVKFSLPLKAGNDNSIHIYSKTADVADLDRIIVGDGRDH
jgi:hypothetical protein